MPDFANPTGETLSEAQRLRLLDLAAEANIHVIEDAAYQALRFEGNSLTSCLALDIRQCGHIVSIAHHLLRHVLQDACARAADRVGVCVTWR